MRATLPFGRLALAGVLRDRSPLALERSRDKAAEPVAERRPGRLALGLGCHFLRDATAALALLANLERDAERARRLRVAEPLRVQGELLGALLQGRLLAPAAAQDLCGNDFRRPTSLVDFHTAQDRRRARLGHDGAGLREPARDGLAAGTEVL